MSRKTVWAASCAVVMALSAAPAHALIWPSVQERVSRALASGDVSERRLAAQRLAELSADVGAPLAERAMGDADIEVRLRAAAAMVTFRSPRAGDRVVAWLSEGDARLRLSACEVIRASPTERSVVALGRVLGDPDAHVRFAAASAMGGSGLLQAVSPLLGHLDDASPEVRAEVARALGRIGDPRAVVPLVGKVQDSVPEVRKTVARALGELGDQRAASALMLALQDAASDVRLEAVAALGRLRSDEAVLAIAPLIDGDDRSRGSGAPSTSTAEVRSAALAALGNIGSEAAAKVLIGALPKDDPSSAHSAVREALVLSGKSAEKALIAVLAGTPSQSAAAGAALALGALHVEAGVQPIVRAMQRGVVPMRFGLRALSILGGSAALPTVLELLDDPDPGVRKEAIAAASALLERARDASTQAGPTSIDGRAVDPASSALRDPATPVAEKIELAKLLGQTGAPRAQAVLLPLVTAKPVLLRLAAIDALGSLGSSSAEVDGALLKALEADEPDVRLAAATALARASSPAAARELLRRLSVSAEEDRGAIGIALSGALARSTDASLAQEAAKAVETAPDAARDGIIEGLGRMRGEAAGRALASLEGGIDDRRKVAEALAGHPENAALARKLAGDPDAGVRANAVWSLGASGGRADFALLEGALRDVDAAVAGNAAAALGRLAAREAAVQPPAAIALCRALRDGRSYVRSNALEALALSASACASSAVGPRSDEPIDSFVQNPAREMLAHDPSPMVRVAAADYLARSIAKAHSAEARPDARALLRCVAEDHDAEVAARCARPLESPGTRVEDVSVYVVGGGHSTPDPRAPFALIRADGLLRLGIADRRGSLFELGTPRGTIRLAVPAALAK